MPDALPATTIPISGLGDWLIICWLAYPDARLTLRLGLELLSSECFPFERCLIIIKHICVKGCDGNDKIHNCQIWISTFRVCAGENADFNAN